MQVVALTLVVALILSSSVALRWASGVPDDIFRWVNLICPELSGQRICG
jgi:hypothetical protein